MDCGKCPKRQGCSEICGYLDRELDPMNRGSFYKLIRDLHITSNELISRVDFARLVYYNRDMMPELEREIIEMFFHEQIDIFEIAKRKGLSPQGVRGLIKKAYNYVREGLKNGT